MTSTQKGGLPLKIVSVFAYLLFLGSNIYIASPPQCIYGNIKQTYLTPSVRAFLVWPIIHILLFCNVIYQFTSAGGKVVVAEEISWGSPLMAIVNAIFLVVWAHHYYTVAFVISLFLVYISVRIGWAIEKEYPPESMGNELLVPLPFVVWDAWIFVICCLTAFEAFGVDATEDIDGIWTKCCVFLVL